MRGSKSIANVLKNPTSYFRNVRIDIKGREFRFAPKHFIFIDSFKPEFLDSDKNVSTSNTYKSIQYYLFLINVYRLFAHK